MDFFLTTSRVGFRNWQSEDIPLATALWGNPLVTQFLGGPFAFDWITSRLESEIALEREQGMQYWPIFLLKTGEHVGCCGVRPYDRDRRVDELGYHLRPEFWGQGLAAEAAAAAIQYAFATLGTNALFAGHFPENERSRRVLLKLGFEYQGMKVYPQTGMLEPTYLLQNPGLPSTGHHGTDLMRTGSA